MKYKRRGDAEGSNKSPDDAETPPMPEKIRGACAALKAALEAPSGYPATLIIGTIEGVLSWLPSAADRIDELENQHNLYVAEQYAKAEERRELAAELRKRWDDEQYACDPVTVTDEQRDRILAALDPKENTDD